MLSNLNGAQTAALLASEVVPGVLILLPATTGGITKSLQMYCDMAGSQAPEFLPGILALLITASIAGVGKVGTRGRGGLLEGGLLAGGRAGWSGRRWAA